MICLDFGANLASATEVGREEQPVMAEESNMDWRSLEEFTFGDSPELADELAGLVLAGKKRATCWAASDGPKTHAGKRRAEDACRQAMGGARRLRCPGSGDRDG